MRSLTVLLALPALTGHIAFALPHPVLPLMHKVESWDGTQLMVSTTEPLLVSGQVPLVIMTNSWFTPCAEYFVKAFEWALDGYLCVCMEARGWYGSGGLVDVAGPNTLKDASFIIDWALKKFPRADPARIAMGGISYGGMIAQLVAAHDPRVRVVITLSGGSGVLADLYWQNTPAFAWGWLLDLTGRVPFIGKEDPSIQRNLNNLLNHQNMSEVADWSRVRSMLALVDQINKNRPAFYMSHQHEDNLFHSDVELGAYAMLKVPKKIDVNQGTHASAEGAAIFGLSDAACRHIWSNVRRWLDHWLKGVTNGVTDEPPVQMQVGGLGVGGPYVNFSNWPPPASELTPAEFALGPRGGADFGRLVRREPRGRLPPVGAAPDTIHFSKTNEMTTGVLGVSDLFKEMKPITAHMDKLNRGSEIAFRGDAVKAPTRFCGVPKLRNLSVVPSGDEFQLVAYIYDVDGSDTGHLITHGVLTIWKEAGAKAGTAFMIEQLGFHSCCHQLAAGHSLVLGVNMHDGLYEPASTNVSVIFDYNATVSATLEVASLNSEPADEQEVVLV